MATIAEAMPHPDHPEWRSHIDSPACRSQAGPFHSLTESSDRQFVPITIPDSEFCRFVTADRISKTRPTTRLNLLS